jgi:hypothetical protein
MMSKPFFMRYTLVLLFLSSSLFAQKNITAASDATAPLHALQPDYPTHYGAAKPEEVQSVIVFLITLKLQPPIIL